MRVLNMNYKVTYASFPLDEKPVIKTFDEHYEMEEWIFDEVQRRMDYVVQHSPYTISEEEYQEIEENEYQLVRIEKL